MTRKKCSKRDANDFGRKSTEYSYSIEFDASLQNAWQKNCDDRNIRNIGKIERKIKYCLSFHEMQRTLQFGQ